jgi:hypothetical protein
MKTLLLSAVTRITFAVPLILAGAAGLQWLAAPTALAAMGDYRILCGDDSPTCTETPFNYNYEGQYVGHDEPSLLFYSSTPGSGNSSRYLLRLPEDPPNLPKQNGTGGTFNFQLHPAFWFGMAMCDTQSYPLAVSTCTPNSDTNIFDNPDSTKPDFIGNHPGTAFMEMQFYPPGWVEWPPGNSCDPLKWCAALNIDSLSQKPSTGQVLNSTCTQQVGQEYVNFAFITKNGKAQAPANPVEATAATFTPDSTKDLFMNSGDWLLVDIHDTPDGVTVLITDLTTGQTGSMTASAANGFGQVQFAPAPSTNCTNIPYDFHPMYSTSSEHTSVPWATHSYNIAFSDEIGHFEYCNAIDSNGNCTKPGVDDAALDGDDTGCFSASESSRIQITGCTSSESDFDGESYQLTWPGTLQAPGQDTKYHPSAILFSSPLFTLTTGSGRQNYDRIAFETDLPAIENATNPACNVITGANCVNPPIGASFYPIYSTRNWKGACVWQLGGANLPQTIDDFGGNSTAEYGSLLQRVFQAFGSTTAVVSAYQDFRQVLSSNPCPQDPRLLKSVGG